MTYTISFRRLALHRYVVPAFLFLGAHLIGAAQEDAPAKPAADDEKRESNRLIDEKSPYLLQHAYNPVNWYPWGDEAFEKARKEDKPIFLSIGYSTCHWCHVMERESFEDEEIAAYLNEHFVSIKVDREERPDVDEVYMTAVQAMTGGHGGWPLSVFLTPERKPFVGGTYFPPRDDPQRGPGFLTVLGRIVELWNERRGDLESQAERLTAHVAGSTTVVAAEGLLENTALEAGFRALRELHDPLHGGFAGPPRHAPKFPRTSTLDFLLRFSRVASFDGERAREAIGMVEATLSAMVRGGIRDHLAGGFHRYSTDRFWLVPHFEKMLYDQALIARTLIEAYLATGNEGYRDVARETLDYVLHRMTGPSGEFFSAEDADTDGVEGKTYTWTRAEILEVLGEERGPAFVRYYGVSEEGNFEEGGEKENVLHLAADVDVATLAAELELSTEELQDRLAVDRARLLAVRDRRPQPLRDDKVLSGWNGLAISAMARAAQATGDARYAEAARRASEFVLTKLSNDGRLARRYRQGETVGRGFLEDHAYLVEGLLDLYETDGDPRWLREAVRLGRDLVELFWDAKNGGFYSTSPQHEELIVRSKEYYDGAVPSGNAVAFLDVLRLATYTTEERFAEIARSYEKIASALISDSPGAYPAHLCAAFYRLEGAREIVVVGPRSDALTTAMTEAVHRRFLPAKILVRVESAAAADGLADLVPVLEGKTMIETRPTAFVCRNRVCKLPSRSVEALVTELEGVE